MLPNQALILNNQFKIILKEMNDGKAPMFVTGSAGTGKSTLLQIFRKSVSKNIVVVAPTGIAALNVKGQTIHSFFKFPPKLLHPSDISKRKNYRLYMKIDILIIDEISMVRADLLDNIDYFLKVQRNDPRPFGGVKIIMFGDLFQLPPVIATAAEKEFLHMHYESPYFFSARVFDHIKMECFELNQTYRQTDKSFIQTLNNIRNREMDYDDLEFLNQRYLAEVENDEYYITLCTRNVQVSKINQTKLTQLETEEFIYYAKINGHVNMKQIPTDEVLKLKLGAQVMFVANDPEKRYVNGTIAKIVDIGQNHIKASIKTISGEIKYLDVEPFEWEIIQYKPDIENPKWLKSEKVGSFKQYPIKLSWAITIHKSQGKTYDRVIVDLGEGAFTSGQTYVALSRCTSLEGIILKRKIQPRDIMVDPIVSEFYQSNL